MTVTRLGDLDDHTATVAFAERVLEEAEALLERRKAALSHLAQRWAREPTPVRWAVETFVAPSKWRGGKAASAVQQFASSGPVGVQVGMLVGRHDALLVPPHGQGGWDNLPEGSYPSTLRGRTPEGWRVLRDDKGTTPARSHQRAAWAQAGAAHLMYPSPEGHQAPAVAQEAAEPSGESDRAGEVLVARTLHEMSGAWRSHWHKPKVLVRCARIAAEKAHVDLPEARIPAVVKAVALKARRPDADALRDKVRKVLEEV